MEQSKKFKLNEEDGKKIAKSFALCVIGASITFVADLIPMIDFGQFSPLAYALSPMIVNIVRKILEGDY